MEKIDNKDVLDQMSYDVKLFFKSYAKNQADTLGWIGY